MSEEERKFLTVDEAKEKISDNDTIHVFANPGVNMLVGADWSRKQVIALIEKSETREIGGEMCRKMRHGLVVYDGSKHWFIESDKIT